MSEKKKCPKCGSDMQVGFILEKSEDGRQVSNWVSGVPETTFWSFGVKIKDREQYPIQSFRCSKCGYLESYANATQPDLD